MTIGGIRECQYELFVGIDCEFCHLDAQGSFTQLELSRQQPRNMLPTCITRCDVDEAEAEAEADKALPGYLGILPRLYHSLDASFCSAYLV